MSVATKVQALADAYGSEERVEQMLNLLLQFELEDDRRRLAEYERELKVFEERYGMDSATMDEKFESGELGDDMDFFEWTGLYAVYRSLFKKTQKLEQTL